MKHFLTDEDKVKVENILKKELSQRKEIVFAYLHGSFLLPVPCGDVDIAVYLDESTPFCKDRKYEAELAMSLDHLAGLPVDVLTLNNAPVALRYHVTRGKVLFSKNEKARFDFLEQTWREYFDYQPLLRAFLNDLLAEPEII